MAKIDTRDVIYRVPQTTGKIYIREQSGFYQRLRRGLNSILMTLFVLLPFISYQGQQAIQFDIGAQTFRFFLFTLYPHDLLIFALVFMSAAFMLLYITKLYGRVWCGFSCPQTIWTFMFNWIERRIEGTHNQSKKLDAQGANPSYLIKKTVKHGLWLALSLITSLVFMSYFIPVNELYQSVFTLNASELVLGWVFFFAACTYINGGWIREKMCLHICPYARFQSAMFDDSTSLVTYNASRGETRGSRKISQPKPTDKGDCVDCNLCVQVCPVGIDIRQGLQYECINCGLCVDACDAVMDKFGYARGLINFMSKTIKRTHVSQQLGYGVAIILCLLSMFMWGYLRSDVEVSVMRDRQALYQVNVDGDIENTYTLKLLNKSDKVKRFTLSVQSKLKFVMNADKQLVVKPGENTVFVYSLISPENTDGFRSDIHFVLTDLNDGQTIIKKSVFFHGS